MRSFAMFAAAFLLTSGATAQAVTPAEPSAQQVVVKKIVRADGKEIAAGSPEEEALLAQCNAHKFETKAVIGEGANKRVTRIKLCAKAGESDAQWIGTLRSALVRLQDMDEIAPASREQILAEMKAEIVRLEAAPAKTAP